MGQVLSDKKNLQEIEFFAANQSLTIKCFLSKYDKLFVVHRRDNMNKAS